MLPLSTTVGPSATRAGRPTPEIRPRRVIPLPGVAAPPIHCSVVHQVPGRVRLRLPELQTDPQLGQRLAAFLDRQPGVHSTRVSAAAASLIVTYEPDLVSTAVILGWLRGGVPLEAKPGQAVAGPDDRPLMCGALALGLGLLGAPALVTAPLLVASAVPIVGRAIAGVKDERQLSADALDAAAIGVLLARGSIPSAALSATLIAGGELIRAMTARRSQRALTGLLSTAGQSAWVVRDGRKQRVSADTLAPGDVVVTYPGELLVVDGAVVRGRAMVDQKTLTGESTPVLKVPGERVYASTVLREGKLYVRAEQVGAQTRASRIVHLLENAPAHDTRLANYARRYADRLVLPTFGLATAVLAATGDVARAVSVLIVDFATGIRVSAPTTVLASMTAAVQQDVLVKGGRALEQLAAVDTLLFDKTGTLTAGAPHVVQTWAAGPDLDSRGVLALAAGAERRLTHPAAEAIVKAAERARVPIPERGESHFAVGLGVRAEIDGRTVLVGSPRFLERNRVPLSAEARARADAAGRRGASMVFVARDGQLVGALAYADQPRPEARAVLDRLRARGIRSLIMVTGDTAQVAHAVADELGIDQVEAEVFPERKAEIVQALQAEGRVVGVVGDGINDSPALAFADVSVSLQAASDVARETADIVLHGDLHGLPEAVDLARQAMRLIRQNLAIVGVPNAAALVLATLGLAGPVAATALNNGSSVAAAVNSLRPMLGRPPSPDHAR